MQLIDLERFQSIHMLGIGATYEAYAALDRETGQQVVLKRPWAQFLRNGQHRSIDELSARLIEIHRLLGDSVSHISRLIGFTERTRHDQFFGDTHHQEYHILVEERARGFPLVGDAKDKFRGIPIGLGQNLFALYPLVPHTVERALDILQQLLEVQEAFIRINYLVLDLRPQNVFFDPLSGRITVIDIATFQEDSPTRAGQAADLHDCFAELCKFYLAPNIPPTHVNGYREPFGMGPALGFGRDVDRMLQNSLKLAPGPLQETIGEILQKIKNRGYGTVEAFRQDLQHYFTLLVQRNLTLHELPDMIRVWYQGMEMLKDAYWRKFLFDPDADLAHYT